ncbi:MAG TPA: MBL fold metallo-hydrolase [Terriglobales bacterium]|nr:MBL fold metallo-hydrolase [Terriglobales bacterium]
MNVREVTKDVVCIEIGISNCYLVGNKKEWVLVDAGTGGHAQDILKTVRKRFGKKAKPEAILLTHGHFDHAGSASELADHWDVPIYAHRRELPFVDGRSEYPPPDPTVGGFMSFVVRFIPSRNNKVYVGERVREFPSLRKLPGLKGWEVIETPGHTPGHVSFFRKEDRVLIAGDAFTTINQDSMFDVLSKRQSVNRPPVYYTSDWDTAHESVKKLARLEPEVLAAGHGVPMTGAAAIRGLERLAYEWPAPLHGRYVPEPAQADENGIAYLPPSPTDAMPAIAAASAAAMAGTAAVLVIRRRGSAQAIARRAGVAPGEVA